MSAIQMSGLISKIKNIFEKQLYTVSLYTRQMCGTIVILLIARYLSVYDYGLFSSYKSIATFCLLFANLDFDIYNLVSSKANKNEVRLKISLFIINAMSIVLLTALGSFLFHLDNRLLFFLVVLRTFFDGTFFALVFPYFQATKKFNTIAKINIAYSLVIVAIAVVSYILKFSLMKFILLNVIAGALNFIQCSFVAKINYFMAIAKYNRFFQMLDKTIWSYIGSSLTSYVYTQISSLYVALFLSKEEAALFFAAFTISTVASLFVAAQIAKILPEMINKTASVHKKIIKKNIITMAVVLGGIVLFFVFFGKYLLKLIYSKDYYTSAQDILIILTLANLVIGIGRVFGNYIAVIGKQIIKVRIKLETSVLTIISLCALHKFGVEGAALAVLISGIYNTMRYALFSLKMLKIELKKEQNDG